MSMSFGLALVYLSFVLGLHIGFEGEEEAWVGTAGSSLARLWAHFLSRDRLLHRSPPAEGVALWFQCLAGVWRAMAGLCRRRSLLLLLFDETL